jgi:prevent-host-death family protein
MKTVSATEASRSFAAILDQAERGETTVVTRGGKRIAVIGPTTSGNAGILRQLLEASPTDDHFGPDVRTVRGKVFLDPAAWPEG